MSSKAKPWERHDKEGSDAYADFIVYRDMGRNRSLEAVGQELGKSKAILERWSARFGWVKRSQAWDDHLQVERDKEAAKHAAEVERRRLAEIQAVFDLGQSFREITLQGLKFPLATKTVSKDGKTTVIEPARWSLRDLAVFAKLSVELKAAALAAWGKDSVDMSDAELEAVISAADDDSTGSTQP